MKTGWRSRVSGCRVFSCMLVCPEIPMCAYLLSVLLLAGVHLVDRRGRQEKPDPHRQVELGTLLESIPEAALVCDSSGTILEANAEAERLFGLSRTEFVGGQSSLLAHKIGVAKQNSQGDLCEHVLEQTLSGESVRQVRARFRSASDGRHVDVLVSSSPLHGAGNAVIGALLVLRDITEIEQLHGRLADTQRHYAVGQMAAGIAHDFNNVLDAISEAAHMLAADPHSGRDDRKLYLDVIEKAVQRGAEISERIRDYLRSGTGAQEEIDIREVLEDVVELTRPIWQRTHVKVECHLNGTAAVSANPADLRRVFTNLVINAIEAMPKGGTLTINLDTTPDTARVSVSDTGMGIAAEHRKRIFTPYFTTKSEGTGLGLSGAHRTITALKGSIRFDSEPGKGTTFHVELPRAAVRSSDVDKAS